MNRPQLFDTPHKAMRLAFSQLLTQAGKVDFSQLQDAVALKNKMVEVFALVKSHSHHEDDICFADLDKIAPNATQHDRDEHIRLHNRLDDLTNSIKTIIDCIKMGQNEINTRRAIYTDLCNLHAEMLIHMMEEERDTQPVFWQYMTDEQLQAFEPRIMSNMTPELSATWLRYIIPALPYAELVGMFTGMQATAPPFVFEANMRLAQEILTVAEFEKLENAFEPVLA
jgi:iron-sulfur cluster repair protein YtfE (RIC family)